MSQGTGRPRRARLTTRVLLTCAALGAVQAIASMLLSAATPAVAAASPPAYALLAGVHAIFPFLARRLTRTPWTVTITAGVAGALVWPVNAVGPLVLVVFLAGAASFDAMLLRGRATVARMLVAAAVAGVVLFAVSLPVFSPDHLTVPILALTLAGRIVGEAIGVIVAVVLGRGLAEAGVRVR